MITRILVYLALFLGATTALLAYGFDRDERALGAVPAQIQAARAQDSLAAQQTVTQLIQQRARQNQAALDEAIKAQARADAAHEKVMLEIQHRQDAASAAFEEALHDQESQRWAAMPVPADYVRGLCNVLGPSAPGCSQSAPGGQLASSPDSGRSSPERGDALQP